MKWALENQKTRRSMTDEEIKRCEAEAMKRIGRRYNEEKAGKKESLKRGKSPFPHGEGTGGSTADKIAEEEGVSRAKVERAAGARLEVHDAVESFDAVR